MRDDSKHNKKYKVNIVEDNPDSVVYLRDILIESDIFEPHLFFLSAEEVVSSLHGKNKPHADLWLVDMGLPGESGLTIIPSIREVDSKTRILVLTSMEDTQLIVSAIGSGANGYLLKEIEPVLLINELKSVMLGGAPITPKVALRILDEWQNFNQTKTVEKPDAKAEIKTQNDSDIRSLTDRESQILELIAQGETVAGIGKELEISPNTVRKHIEHIYEKMNVNTRIQAIQKGIKMGLLDPLG